jgi:Putative restriction endonuclease
MSTVAPPQPASSLAAPEVYRLTVDEYERLAAAVLDDDRVELIDGYPAYARGRIPIYWIINLVDRQVEVYSNPRRGQYGSSQVFKPGQDVPIVIDGVEVGRIAVADLLPP